MSAALVEQARQSLTQRDSLSWSFSMEPAAIGRRSARPKNIICLLFDGIVDIKRCTWTCVNLDIALSFPEAQWHPQNTRDVP
jgi:hypothetical protein